MRRNDGFTLIELLLVITIIGVLAALVVPRYASRAEQARLAAAKAEHSARYMLFFPGERPSYSRYAIIPFLCPPFERACRQSPGNSGA